MLTLLTTNFKIIQGLMTNLNVFTGHVFHHSREEIGRIFTSGNHL